MNNQTTFRESEGSPGSYVWITSVYHLVCLCQKGKTEPWVIVCEMICIQVRSIIIHYKIKPKCEMYCRPDPTEGSGAHMHPWSFLHHSLFRKIGMLWFWGFVGSELTSFSCLKDLAAAFLLVPLLGVTAPSAAFVPVPLLDVTAPSGVFFSPLTLLIRRRLVPSIPANGNFDPIGTWFGEVDMWLEFQFPSELGNIDADDELFIANWQVGQKRHSGRGCQRELRRSKATANAYQLKPESCYRPVVTDLINSKAFLHKY